MKILSITFHVIDNIKTEWQKFYASDLQILAKNLMEVQKFIISDVESEMINEGQNYNLLLFFENTKLRNNFLEYEFLNIEEIIKNKFNDNVMIFKTILNTKFTDLKF